jgi:hypothetical protein
LTLPCTECIFHHPEKQIPIKQKEISMKNLFRALVTATVFLSMSCGDFTVANAADKKLSRYESTIFKEHLFTEISSVEAVDTSTRTVKLKDSKGESYEIKVSEESANFNQIKVGDQVKIDMTQSVAIDSKDSKAPDKAADEKQKGLVVERAKVGDKPAVAVTGRKIVVAKVRNIKGNSVIGLLLQPQYIKNIKNLKKGDDLFITLTETISIVVEDKPK